MRPLPPLLALLLLCPATATASPLAETFGDSLTLYRKDHLPPAAALPWLQAQPDAAAYFTAWPDEVTLQAWRFGAPEGAVRRRVVIVGGIHGDEAVSYIFPELWRRRLMEDAASGQADGFLPQLVRQGVALYLIPVLNPYGTLAGLRPNFRRPTPDEELIGLLGAEWEERPEWWDKRKGVDLNRNFPVNLPCGGDGFARPDGEGTFNFAAPGGCHEQELYYGGLLHWRDCAPEPANAWLSGLLQRIRPDLLIALHQEARVLYVDTADPKEVAERRWTGFVAAMHAEYNQALDWPAEGRLLPAKVPFGIRSDGSEIPAANAVNVFSPGGYGAALSLLSGAVLTLEMTHDQSDAEADACWFPEGLLYTYAPDFALTSLRNEQRLESLIARFRRALVGWILTLDPACPEEFKVEAVSEADAARWCGI